MWGPGGPSAPEARATASTLEGGPQGPAARWGTLQDAPGCAIGRGAATGIPPQDRLRAGPAPRALRGPMLREGGTDELFRRASDDRWGLVTPGGAPYLASGAPCPSARRPAPVRVRPAPVRLATGDPRPLVCSRGGPDFQPAPARRIRLCGSATGQVRWRTKKSGPNPGANRAGP